MNYKYQNAGIAGKFRLLHKAHVELILRAMGYTDTLHIFIVDLPTYKRYATIEELEACFHTIFTQLDYRNYQIHIINEDLSGEAWDKQLLELVPNLQAMFDSKEPYDNILVQNEFIDLALSREISVSNIEEDMYQVTNYALIAEPFKRYITKTICVKAEVNIALDEMLNRLRMYYDASPLDPHVSSVCTPKVVFTREVDANTDYILYLQQTAGTEQVPTNAVPIILNTNEQAFGKIVEVIDTRLRTDTAQNERTK